MKILLDTAAFYCLTIEKDRLSQKVQALCRNADTQLFLSSLSVAEMMIKHSSGKFPLPKDPSEFIPEERILHHILPLELDEQSALLLSTLPLIHKDPFDRLLICQAIVHEMTILTPDTHMQQYPVSVLW